MRNTTNLSDANTHSGKSSICRSFEDMPDPCMTILRFAEYYIMLPDLICKISATTISRTAFPRDMEEHNVQKNKT